MRTFAIALSAVALVALGCGSDGAKETAVQAESAAEEVSEATEDAAPATEEVRKASEATEASVSGVVGEAKSAKQELKDDSADNKERVNKGFGNATNDIKRTFRGLGKKD